jgi:hypothetical protein
MVFLSTQVHITAMAPPVHDDREVMSVGRRPRVGSRNCTAARRAAVILQVARG